MKHTQLIAAALIAGSLLLSPKAFAADAKKETKKPAAKAAAKERPLPGALGKLNLSDEQKQAVTALMKDTAAKRKEAGSDRDKQRELQKAHEAKLNEILGPEKSAELKKLNEEAAKNRKRGGSVKKSAKPPAKKKGNK